MNAGTNKEQLVFIPMKNILKLTYSQYEDVSDIVVFKLDDNIQTLEGMIVNSFCAEYQLNEEIKRLVGLEIIRKRPESPLFQRDH